MYLKNKNIIFKIRRSKATDYAALTEKNNLISQPKHMLWVVKRTVLMRRFF